MSTVTEIVLYPGSIKYLTVEALNGVSAQLTHCRFLLS